MTNVVRIAFGFCLCILLWCPNIYGKTIISEGSAFIGSGITLEEAKLIALNDARQKALNSIGVFVESEAQVVDYRLTKDEIRTITGAIMTSEVLESSKEIVQDVFVFKIKAKFDISESSLQQALENYQDRSKDQKTIKHLIKTIDRLQKELIKKKKGSPETIEIVDEIDFSTKRLGKLLTTKQVINYELQMQDLYKKKAETYFKINVFPRLHNAITKLLGWEEIPQYQLGGMSDLFLKFVGFQISKEKLIKRLQEYPGCLASVAEEYDKLKLKVRPEFSYRIDFTLPIYVYINQEKLTRYIKIQLGKYFLTMFLSSQPEPCNYEMKPPWLYVFALARTHSQYPRWLKSWNIPLPSRYKLSDIENIKVRIGRVNPRDIQFSFFE